MISQVMSTLAEWAADRIVECGGPEPERITRYHCVLPADCCSDRGLLAVSWLDMTPGKDACDPTLYTRFRVQWRVCWPVPEMLADGTVTLPDTQADQVAALIAEVADCIARAILRLQCDPGPDDAPLVALASCRSWALDAVQTACPQGGCAGVDWTVRVRIRPGG